MARSRVLLVGDGEHPEFHEALAWLERETELRRAASVEEAAATLNRDAPSPDAIVLAQARPGMLSQKDVERLHCRAPLSRLVALLGSWCEGEPRTGRPWPGVIRVYWHQWLTRCERELTTVGILGGRSAWSLPRTSTDAEQLLHMSRAPLPQGRGLLAIRAERLATFKTLADACKAAGYSSVWLATGQWRRVEAPAAVLWDGDSCGQSQAGQIRSLCAAMRPAPLIALLDLVRLEDYQRALAAGASAVIAKPFLSSDLFDRLQRLMKASGRDQPAP